MTQKGKKNITCHEDFDWIFFTVIFLNIWNQEERKSGVEKVP
jgi:hypothetical protein